jgi:hypothetical protein
MKNIDAHKAKEGSSSFFMDKTIFNSSTLLVFMEISTQNNEEPKFSKWCKFGWN